MIKVLVYVSHGIGIAVLDTVFSQIEGVIHLVTLDETVEDVMIKHYARKKGLTCLSFPKEEGVLRGMELLDYCDGILLIGDDTKLRWFLNAGKMMKKKVAWFDEKGRFNE